MPKFKPLECQTCSTPFRGTLDALDVTGNWSWDGASNRVRADMFVALLFNVDPESAEAGLPAAAFSAGIHPEDRDRVLALLRRRVRDGDLYVIEYRVRSADGATRWVLGRGRFLADHRGRPISGHGIIVDITDVRSGERAVGALSALDHHEAETPLERAADFAMAAHRAICELQDPALRARADALLLDLGRRLADQERQARRAQLN
ncbi:MULTISPECIES: PAS domain-containing protein [unclassified Methylobacterium]|uniref:PAS domain-containing protein n=1 Tax=unclassified Methylobacterium TaxID=2615210 RepID=UPI0011C20411|nr:MULTISPECIES: PAS domain-containing protein [unclassified Methylobacterium]QEE40178.1 PAS domain-containing protein [Methylobacterium sp. WL1]TXN58530.1 PAS domain-containing protein [Methylobacterium sp. WL2]